MANQTTSTIVLGVEGMTCSSCVARVEKSLNELPGVTAAVNLALHSAKVEYPSTVSEEQLVQQVEKIGYTATLPHHEVVEDEVLLDGRAGKVTLLERLVIAIVLTVPVIVLAMVPAWQFTYWQWISLLLTTPVVFWCGLPFHRATFLNLRHGTLTMDTLITMGTFAAYGWSVYALFFGAAGDPHMHHTMELFAWQTDPTHNIYLEAAAGVVETNFGIDVPYVIRIKFDGIVNIVDAMGGVTINVEEATPMFEAGVQTMDGTTALAFVRDYGVRKQRLAHTGRTLFIHHVRFVFVSEVLKR